jgi:hypothetical protein
MKKGLRPSVQPKMGLVAQNIKIRLGALSTSQNMKIQLDASVPPKMGPGAQNMKIEPDALDTAQNESGSAKH